METKAFSELFPLFSTASPGILEWLLSIAKEQEFAPTESIVEEEAWGSEIYWIVSGWIKLQRLHKETSLTLEILGRGDSFGEMAILDEPLRFTEAIALSEVKLLSISAQRFIQLLFKEPQLQHRMLQLTVRRLRQFYLRWQLSHQLPGEKLVKTLVFLADNYGQLTEKGTELFNIPPQDLADVADINLEQTQKILEKLQSKSWIEIDTAKQILRLTNPKQLTHLAGQILA